MGKTGLIERPLTTTDLRRQNLSTILTVLHRHGALRRADITERTGLNKSTVLSLVDELSTLGLANESTAVSDGTRGRPSAVVHPNTTGVVVVASEIGVDFARLAVVGLGGSVLQSIDVDVHPHMAGPTKTAQALGEAGVHLLVPGRAVVAAATAIHGVVSPSGHLVTAPNIGWQDLDLAALTKPFLPPDLPVFFGNDAHLGALGEHRRGAGRHVSDLLYLSAERGIGGGLIRQGELQLGAHGHSTEVGHLVVNPKGKRCACGSHGCLETEIGESALLRKAGRRSNARPVIELAHQGDAAAQAAIADVAEWLGFAIGNLVNLLDPQLIIAGGFLGDIATSWSGIVETTATRTSRLGGDRPIEIIPAALERDAALVGAAELAFDRLLQNPTAISPPGSAPAPNPSAPDTPALKKRQSA